MSTVFSAEIRNVYRNVYRDVYRVSTECLPCFLRKYAMSDRTCIFTRKKAFPANLFVKLTCNDTEVRMSDEIRTSGQFGREVYCTQLGLGTWDPRPGNLRPRTRATRPGKENLGPGTPDTGPGNRKTFVSGQIVGKWLLRKSQLWPRFRIIVQRYGA